MGKCVPCLGVELKRSIHERVSNDEMVELLDSIADCNDPFDLKMCASARQPSEKKTKVKREPSEYNKFIGVCMKEGHIKAFGEAPARMKECAARWRQSKK